jgi:hypothetical protein
MIVIDHSGLADWRLSWFAFGFKAFLDKTGLTRQRVGKFSFVGD